MNPVQKYAIEHPRVVCLFFVGVTAYTAYCAFQGGMALQFLRGYGIRDASEALGG